MYNNTLGSKIFDTINAVILVIVAFTMLFPFFYVFAVSFSSVSDFLENDFLFWPKEWVTDAYEYIFSSDRFIRSLLVSIVITVVGTAVNLFFTATMAYALTRAVIGQRAILLMVIFTLLFHAGMIPTYMVVKATGLINSIWSLIIPVAISPYYLIIMRQFFLSIPDELKEAAIMDGANEIQIFRKIILPLSKPALAAFGLFYAVTHWNSYFTGVLYISDPAKWPIQVILRQIVIVNEPNAALGANEMLQAMPPPVTVQMAAILIATLPILIVYPFLQKHFAKGVMLGSVKG
ncbi:carbohydrate ABC transporter permease [Bacillus sp. FJAT-49705]|uniref:Carbohydrate ABC transporter permease n=1 Tax=Cytobacillus citreus TaxID=2833586 RepID=A0ABS5NVI7_9BACI|nr:carbohydrate ABC transporter permease [Cytobacillus citreus]MBS4191601.1 carbohydrate ABC transporter permease [Cytobacillus citreus]